MFLSKRKSKISIIPTLNSWDDVKDDDDNDNDAVDSQAVIMVIRKSERKNQTSSAQRSSPINRNKIWAGN